MIRPFRRLARPARAIAALAAVTGPGALTAQTHSGSGAAATASASVEAGRTAPEAGGVMDLVRLSGAVTLDGIPDEPVWEAVAPLPLTMYEPSFRGGSERAIEIRVAYDEQAIWVAARFGHTDPEDIRAFSLTRDRWSGDDGFGILLDTFNDDENAMRFVGLPLGARMDMSITGDGQSEGGSGGPQGSSWNTFWDLRTNIGADGWTGEMRIPFSSLRFEPGADGSVVMGMMTYAYEPDQGRRWTFPAIPRSAPYTQVSAWQDVRMGGVEPRTPVYVTPYALTGHARTWELDETGEAYRSLGDPDWQVGGDVKISPTPNLTLDLTLNTDFAAVEADQQQVNLTRFSLFFDEKRPFFQERAGIFAFETGAERGTLFYSRRIGLADGRPIRILGGARLVGRVGAWDLGLIEMQTAADGSLPSENFGVVRLRRRVLNPSSFVGGMATSRAGADGRYNVTYGVDSQLRPWGDDYVTVKWLQTVQGGLDAWSAAPSGLDAGRAMVDWTRRSLSGLSYQNTLVWSGPGYDPGVGFEPRSDFARARSDWNYQWYPGEDVSLRRIWLGVAGDMWVRNADDAVETGLIKPFVQVETKPGMSLQLSVATAYEDVAVPFRLGDDADVPVGSYWATEGQLDFNAPRGWTVRPNLKLTAGEFFDGRRLGLDTSFNWPVNRHLELQGGWGWNRIQFEERGQEFDSNLLRLTARSALDIHLSLDTFLQYNSLNDQLTTNARMRYNFREGQDLWLVWNEGLNLERDPLVVPRVPFSEARTLTVKYTHTVQF